MNITGNRGNDDGTGDENEAEPRKEPKKRGKRAKLKIKVESAPPGDEQSLLPVLAPDGTVPILDILAVAVVAARDIPTLQTIHAQAIALEDLVKRYKLAFEEIVKIAVIRLQAERKIGQELMQTVHSGGDRSTLHSANLNPKTTNGGLPDGVNGSMASRYRASGRIHEEVFQRYVAHESERERVPSARGLKSYAIKEQEKTAPPKPRKKNRKQTSVVAEIPDQVIDAVRRCMEVDVCVGGKDGVFKGATRLDADTLKPKQLHGNVFVAECLEPIEWLLKLAEARLKGGAQQVIVALSGTPFEPWFRAIEEGKWVCCFVQIGTHLVLAYHGRAKHGFWNAARELGPVMHAGDHEA